MLPSTSAAQQNHSTCLRHIVKAGAATCEWTLWHAIYSMPLDDVKWLLEATGLPLDHKHMHIALHLDKIDVVHYLKARGALPLPGVYLAEHSDKW